MIRIFLHPGSGRPFAAFNGEQVMIYCAEPLNHGAARWLAMWIIAVTHERAREQQAAGAARSDSRRLFVKPPTKAVKAA